MFILFLENYTKKFGKKFKDIWDSFGSDFSYPANFPAYIEEYAEEDPKITGSDIPPGKIQCLPLPGKIFQDFSL